MEHIEYIDEVREAYERTLRFAAEENAVAFYCSYLKCGQCPFVTSKGSCGDTGELRTVQEWQHWWYDKTGERDTRTVGQILAGAQTENCTEETMESAAEESANTIQPTEESSEPIGEDTLQPTVPNVDIIWTTATGQVKHRAGPIALMDTNLRQFSKEVEVWISEMIKPDTCNSIADSITFVAREETGAVLANVELYAEMFGKQKAWVKTTDHK